MGAEAVGVAGVEEGIGAAEERWQARKERKEAGDEKRMVVDRREVEWKRCGSVCGQSRACVADRATNSATVKASKRAGRWRVVKKLEAMGVEEMKGRCEPLPKREGLVAESDRLLH